MPPEAITAPHPAGVALRALAAAHILRAVSRRPHATAGIDLVAL
jgi:hypothetical protein